VRRARPIKFALVLTLAGIAGAQTPPAPQPDPRLAAALQRYDRGDRDGAKQELERLRVAAKDDGGLLVTIADELETRHEYAAAEPFARRATELMPDFGPAHMRLGVSLIFSDRVLEAEQVFRAAAKRFSGTQDEPDLVFNLGMACAMQNKRTEAGEWFAKALALRPKENLYRFSAAENDRNLKRFKEAEAGFRLAMVEPRHPDAGWKLAVTLAEMERYEEAEALFRTQLRDLPPASRVNAGFEYAAFLFDRGRAAEALPMLESIVKARPGHRLGWYYLARSYRAVGRKEDAAAAVKRYQALQAEADRSEDEYLLSLIRTHPTAPASASEQKEMPSRR